MDESQDLNLDSLAGLTNEQVLEVLAINWPWPMSSVQSWFEDLWNNIYSWVSGVASAAYNLIAPLFGTVWEWITVTGANIVAGVGGLFSQVWSWITSSATWLLTAVIGLFNTVWEWITVTGTNIVAGVGGLFSQVWSWITTGLSALWSNIQSGLDYLWGAIQSIASTVADKVTAITSWFSNEFIDPFIDWLLQLPGKLWDALFGALMAVGGVAERFFRASWARLKGVAKTIWGWVSSYFEASWARLLTVLKTIGGWIVGFFRNTVEPVIAWLSSNIPRAFRWLMSFLSTIASELISWAKSIFSFVHGLFDQFVTPIFSSLFGFFERFGQVTPDSGKSVAMGIIGIGSIVVGGLAVFTMLNGVVKHFADLGLGSIAAMIADVTNYKMLTGAFISVLALVYISKPLTYYYNRLARPNLPSEGAIADLAHGRHITMEAYSEEMKWHGFPDKWIDIMGAAIWRPLPAYMIRSLAEAGVLDDAMLQDALEEAGYKDEHIPYIKRMMNNLAATALAAVSTSTAMSRYQEGFDGVDALRGNLSVLGVPDAMLDRYVFAAQLKYLMDYQTDLKSYYIDAYHRRDIEEPELRSNLAATGLDPQRLNLIIQAQQIKRLAAPKPAVDPSVTVNLETIRAKRKKNLITHDGEVAQIVALGEEMPYALAIADNDEVSLAPAGAVAAPVVLLAYETEEGKIQVDTIRRLARATQMSYSDEIRALLSLAMPQGLASAIADNDQVRIKKASSG